MTPREVEFLDIQKDSFLLGKTFKGEMFWTQSVMWESHDPDNVRHYIQSQATGTEMLLSDLLSTFSQPEVPAHEMVPQAFRVGVPILVKSP